MHSLITNMRHMSTGGFVKFVHFLNNMRYYGDDAFCDISYHGGNFNENEDDYRRID